MEFVTKLDTQLLRLASQDWFTLRNACAGVHVFGGIGSGKTSGSGAALAGAYLRAGMGGLVLCAKADEVERWVAYAKVHRRSESVLLFDDTLCFNFMDYELVRHGLDGINNVVECLMRILEAAEQAYGHGTRSSDPFWAQATRQLLSYTIPAIYYAYGSVTVEDILKFVTSAAGDESLYKNAAWREKSFAAQALEKAVENVSREIIQNSLQEEQSNLPASVQQRVAHVQKIGDYWFNEYPAIPDKTRGNIQISITAQLDRFRHGRMNKTFCSRTDVVPEMTFHGMIIIMAMPALVWKEDGMIAQQLFKFMWQRAVESRNGLDPEHRQRPVFLWADEAQYFVSLKDHTFLTTCRDSLACVVFLTQTLPTYYSSLGESNRAAADGLVGTFNTKVFHLNSCNVTNKYASDLIGRAVQQRANSSVNTGTSSGGSRNEGSSTSYGYSGGMNEGANTSRGSSSGTSASSSAQGSSYGSTSSRSSGSGESWGRNVGSTVNHGQNWGQGESWGQSEGQTYGQTEQMDNILEPNFFASQLKSGGAPHQNQVSAVWFRAGAQFKATRGGHFLIPLFKQ